MIYSSKEIIKTNKYNYENIIGTKIIYSDYLGIDHSGIIGWVEDYNGNTLDEDDKMIAWIYVVDDDEERNVHEYVIDQDKRIMYADLRLSTEIILIED